MALEYEADEWISAPPALALPGFSRSIPGTAEARTFVNTGTALQHTFGSGLVRGGPFGDTFDLEYLRIHAPGEHTVRRLGCGCMRVLGDLDCSILSRSSASLLSWSLFSPFLA